MFEMSFPLPRSLSFSKRDAPKATADAPTGSQPLGNRHLSMPQHLKSGLTFEREIYVKSQFLSRGEQNKMQ